MGKNSPLISEFETEEQEAGHTRWLKAKVAAALRDSRPAVAHEDVMAEAEAIVATSESRTDR
ncbi:hypothetical protein DKG74_11375 [Zavarzinia aquatilis]|uniref:Stability determinant domain-containing protein n=2 Tax=Zavarzinia aquatilis TaxID=2211142 RepID=A0A317E893_9PROT|nr:hypothetical protein DKG74_11375 [Zavarzinia aquatilis]